jgi:triacylglycerol lipase
MILHQSFPQKSHLFACISEAVYLPPEQNREYFAKLGVAFDYIEHATNELYVLYNEDDLIIAFRGTELKEFENLVEDLDVDMVDSLFCNGKVHHGFQQALDNLWPRLLPVLKQRLKQQHVWVTGHSLGAAMAVLAACRLHHETTLNIKPKAVFTYGCPRNSDTRFVNSLPMPHYRWVNNADVVTKVPTFPYVHGGDMFYINRNGQVKKMSFLGRVTDQLAASVKGLFKGKAIPLNDHSISQYSAHLKKYQDENPH